MEHKVKILAPEELIEPLLALLEDTDSVPLMISGSSMTPFLVHGRDTVYLSKITSPPKRGDMILYRRSNGQYILHRVHHAGDTYTMVGDGQVGLEPGIRREQMLATVTAVCRDGKVLKKGSPLWEFFEKCWIRMVPLRPAVRTVGSRLKRMLK